jgi:hypothetical protein
MSLVKMFNGFEVPSTCEEERLDLAVRHAHPRDLLIAFAETIPNSDEHHKYFIRGNREYCSVSGFYKQFFQEFDKREVALKMLQRDDFWSNEKYGEYWPIVKDTTLEESIEIVIKLWNDNGDLQSKLGTDMHRKIELYLNNSQVHSFEDIDFKHFLQLYKDLTSRGLTVFRTEMMMFDDESKLCGCADVIFINNKELQNIEAWKSGLVKLRVHLGDWKRSKQIEKCGYGKIGKFVCKILPNSNYYHYSLQLNLYKYMLEKNYNLIVESMTMYVFHPDNDTYLEFPVKNYQRLILKMIQLRIDNHFQELPKEEAKPKTIFIRKRKIVKY